MSQEQKTIKKVIRRDMDGKYLNSWMTIKVISRLHLYTCTQYNVCHISEAHRNVSLLLGTISWTLPIHQWAPVHPLLIILSISYRWKLCGGSHSWWLSQMIQSNKRNNNDRKAATKLINSCVSIYKSAKCPMKCWHILTIWHSCAFKSLSPKIYKKKQKQRKIFHLCMTF